MCFFGDSVPKLITFNALKNNTSHNNSMSNIIFHQTRKLSLYVYSDIEHS